MATEEFGGNAEPVDVPVENYRLFPRVEKVRRVVEVGVKSVASAVDPLEHASSFVKRFRNLRYRHEVEKSLRRLRIAWKMVERSGVEDEVAVRWKGSRSNYDIVELYRAVRRFVCRIRFEVN